MSAQPLVYGMTRQLVDAQNTGKALSAINLAFFLGAALMQSATGVVAAVFGLPAVLLFMAAVLIIGTWCFCCIHDRQDGSRRWTPMTDADIMRSSSRVAR